MAESNREEITKLEALYASNPGGRVFVHLAEACRKGGEHERARGILDEGLARHTDSASGYVVLGRVLSDLGETPEAEDAFRRVLELDPGNLIALRWLGDSARARNRFDEAAAHYRDLLARSPNDDSIRALLASSEAASAGMRDDDSGADDASAADVASGARDADEPDDAAADVLSGEQDRTDDEGTDEDLTPISPFAAAPGHTDDGPDESVEFGDVDQDSLPGDLASFANLAHGGVERVTDDDEDPPETDIESLDWSGMGDVADDAFVADLDTTQDSGFAEDSLSPGDGVDELDASPLDVHALDAAAGDVAPFEPPVFVEPSWAGEPPEEAEAEFDVEAEDVEAEDVEAEVDLGDEVEAALDVGDEFAAALDDVDAGIELETGYELEAAFEDDVDVVVDDEADDEPRPPEPDAELAAVVDGGPDDGVFELLTEEAELEAAQAAAVDTPQVAGLEAGGYGSAVGGPIADLDKADEGLHTETIAELYSSQGFHDRAAEVYRSLLRRRPGDARLEARLAESEAAMRPHATGPSLIEEDESGEVWLSAAGSGWTGASDDASDPSPYGGWTESGDDGAAAPPIRSYLQALIGWRAADAADASNDAPAAPAAEVEPPQPAAEAGHSDAAAASAGADSGGWTPDDIAAEPWAAPTAAPSADVSAAAAASSPAAAEPAEPVAPAAPAEPAAPAGRPAPVRRSSGDPVEDAFLDWYGEGAAPAAPAASSQADEPAAAAEATAASEPAASAARAVPEDSSVPMAAAPWEQAGAGEAGSSAEDSSAPTGASAEPASDAPTVRLEETSSPAEETTGESDEDLEMFRSWLQSLKK